MRLHSFPQASRQRGVVLFIALIVLVAMTLAAVGLVRSSGVATEIAGNMAFKQSSVTVSDLGLEAAYDNLNTYATTVAETVSPSGCTTACVYYPTMRMLDSQGLPTSTEFVTSGAPTIAAINWSNVAAVTSLPSALNGYEVKYVVERLCLGPAPVTDVEDNCYNDVPSGGRSRKGGGSTFTLAETLYYRVTVRAAGPRNTVSFVQAVLSRS